MAGLDYPRPALQHEGVCLRPWSVADSDGLVAAWNDPAIQANCVVPTQRTIADASDWIAGHNARVENGLALDLVVTDAVGTAVKGEVGLGPFDNSRNAAVLGFWIAPDYRRSGLARAAVTMVTQWSRTQDLSSLLAQTRPTNSGSVAVLQACGFKLLAGRVGSPAQGAGLQTWVLHT